VKSIDEALDVVFEDYEELKMLKAKQEASELRKHSKLWTRLTQKRIDKQKVKKNDSDSLNNLMLARNMFVL